MLPTTHAVWSYIIFSNFTKTKKENLAVITASIIPDIEILFWTSVASLDILFRFNPFRIDYYDLLYGSGLSFRYWPLTLITNSLVTIAILMLILAALFPKKRRIIAICWLVLVFHIILDAFTHKQGNMLFWPLSIKKYLGRFDYLGLPPSVIAIEQMFSFSLLFIFLPAKKMLINMAHEKKP